MAIYRGRRRLTGRRAGLVLALVAVLAGALLWALARQPEPAPAARPDPVADLAGILEIVPVSYGGAVRDGAIVPGQEVQYRGAQDAVRRARALFEEAKPAIAARDAAAARLAEATLRQIEEAVAARRPPAEVRSLTDRLLRALSGLPREGGG